jgi:hypothetical protein
MNFYILIQIIEILWKSLWNILLSPQIWNHVNKWFNNEGHIHERLADDVLVGPKLVAIGEQTNVNTVRLIYLLWKCCVDSWIMTLIF